jgi:hypothetical protein
VIACYEPDPFGVHPQALASIVPVKLICLKYTRSARADAPFRHVLPLFLSTTRRIRRIRQSRRVSGARLARPRDDVPRGAQLAPARGARAHARRREGVGLPNHGQRELHRAGVTLACACTGGEPSTRRIGNAPPPATAERRPRSALAERKRRYERTGNDGVDGASVRNRLLCRFVAEQVLIDM